MNTVLNLLSAAAVVVAGAYAAATTSAPEAVVVQSVTKASHAQMLNKPLTEPQWAESPFMQPEPQMASNQAAPVGDVLRGAQWQNVSDDAENAHVPKPENQRWVF
ncbi:MAG: hypothetical protein AAAB16_16305 [Pseudomonas sp.]|uniref:hypothetical protein n=1 Tax=Pseudomonas sp. TaxID=306 RepID=UPI0030F1255F